MKKSELKNVIKEELVKVLEEAKIKINYFTNSTLDYYNGDKHVEIDAREVSWDPKSKNPIYLFIRRENNGNKTESDKHMKKTLEKRVAVPPYAVKDILIKFSNGDIKKNQKFINEEDETMYFKKSDLRKMIKEEILKEASKFKSVGFTSIPKRYKGDIYIHYNEGSFPYHEELYSGYIEQAEKHAIKKLNDQYKHRKTSKDLWAQFFIEEDDGDLGSGWYEDFKRRIKLSL